MREPSTNRHPVDDLEPANELDIDPALLEQIWPVAYRHAYRDAGKKLLFVLDNALLHILSNKCTPTAVWQVAFGLDSARCEGRSEAEVARMLGVSRATISKGASAFRRSCGLPPNQGKDVEAMAIYSETRLGQIPA